MTARRLNLILSAIIVLGILMFSFKRIGGFTGAIFSDSEPPGIYREVSGPIHAGGMVILRQLAKDAVAGPGDTIQVTPQGTYAHGQLWPDSAPVISDRWQPYQFGWLTLKDGQYWLLGKNPMSWDSRYVGPFPLDMIEAPLKPWWTWSNGYAAGTRPWD